MSLKLKSRSLDSDQRGVVAIFSVLIIMGILTLLALAFSNVTRQAQRRTLDDHLSTQAFYAAESGINLAANNLVDKDTCGPLSGQNYEIDTANNIGVSCLKIKLNPERLEYKEVPLDTAGGVVGYISVPNASNLIEVNWSTATGNEEEANGPSNIIDDQSTQTSPRMYRAGTGLEEWSSDHVGILRVDLIPVDSLSPQETYGNRTNLVNDSYSYYLYPTRNSGVLGDIFPISSGPSGPNGHGKTVVVNCTPRDGYRCSSQVQLSGSHQNFYYRLTSIYSPVRASLRVSNISSGGVVSGSYEEISDGQAIIDSTGRANDVFRRLQVRVPIGKSADLRLNPGVAGIDFPSYALFSENICKRYIIYSETGNDSTNQGTESCRE